MERDYHKNDEFVKFSAKEKPADITYLTSNQLFHLNDIKIEDETLVLVKDYFCLACFTGLRFSDIAQIRKEYFKEGSLFLPIKKTKETMMIPINKHANQILEKYDFDIKVYSNAITNKKLKIIGKLAEFNQEVILKKYKGSETIEIRKPLSEHLTFHLARRTFITVSLEQKMTIPEIMAIVGHKDYKTLKRYIKITDKVKIVAVEKAWNNLDKDKEIKPETKKGFKDDEPRSFSDWLKNT
jgi:integrase